MRRYLSIWFPTWSTDRWRRQRAEPARGPLALTASGQGGVRLMAVDRTAAAIGLSAGMSLADARALVPQLMVADAEPAADAKALAAIADWATRYSPWSAVDGEDCIRLDITGCPHLFGGEEPLQADAERRLAHFGLAARAAIADTPAAAWAWARYRAADRPGVLSDGAMLRALPVAALRLPDETTHELQRLGLRTIGQVAALPRGPVSRRLGAVTIQRLDQLFGRAPEPISPRQITLPWLSRVAFAEPIGRREDIDTALRHLLAWLCKDLAEQGLGARRLELAFYRVDAQVQRLAIGTSRPTHEPAHLARLFEERLETIDPGFGIETMVLEAPETEPTLSRQAALAVGDEEAGDIAALIDRLQNRLGRDRVVQLTPVESHAPECAEMRAPALSIPAIKSNRPPSRPARPVKLLIPPEPIEAMAPVPDDPPLSFRWRRVSHRVAHADGPERIGPEWWKPRPGRPRDYYRVEDSEGRRFWLYREGLYGAPQPPRWFLHGFFP